MHMILMMLGLLILAGTVGSSDYYDQCRAAVDCVAGEPLSLQQTTLQLMLGLVLMVLGRLGVKDKEQE